MGRVAQWLMTRYRIDILDAWVRVPSRHEITKTF
jgi:hypothetical protein